MAATDHDPLGEPSRRPSQSNALTAHNKVETSGPLRGMHKGMTLTSAGLLLAFVVGAGLYKSYILRATARATATA